MIPFESYFTEWDLSIHALYIINLYRVHPLGPLWALQLRRSLGYLSIYNLAGELPLLVPHSKFLTTEGRMIVFLYFRNSFISLGQKFRKSRK